MSNPVLPDYIAPYKPVPNVTPFTIRDGETMLRKVKGIVKYLNLVLVPWINVNYTKLGDDFEEQVNILIAAVNAAIEEVIDSSIVIQDPLVAQLVADVDSDTREALDELYATVAALAATNTNVTNLGTSVGTLSTTVNNLVTLTTTGRLGVDAMGQYVTETELAAALANVNTPPYNFTKAHLEYGVRLGPNYGLKKMPQSAYVCRALDGEIFYSIPTTGTTVDRETLVVIRCGANGAPISKMTFTDGGHGNVTNVEVASNGTLYIWIEYPNYDNVGGTSYSTARIPWVDDVTRNYAFASTYFIGVLSNKLTSHTVHIDEAAGKVGVRANIANNVNATFTVHDLASIIANIWAPSATMTHNYVNSFTQGWTYHGGYWYMLHGTVTNAVPTYVPGRIDKVDATTGVTIATRSIERARMGASKLNPGGETEPEGISIAYGPTDHAVVVFGIGSGPAGARAFNLWMLGEGFSPFRASVQRADKEIESSAWDSAGYTLASGFTTPTDDRKLVVRRNGDWIEIMGQVDGTFVVATGNTVGNITSEYRNARTNRLTAAKNQGSTSQSSTARIEILATGDIVVYLDRTDTGTGSWVDIPFQRYPLFSVAALGA